MPYFAPSRDSSPSSWANLTGIPRDADADPEGLVGERGVGLLEVVPLPRGVAPFCKKIEFLHLKCRVVVNSERYFCPRPRQKNVEFPPEMVIWWTLKMYFLGKL